MRFSNKIVYLTVLISIAAIFTLNLPAEAAVNLKLNSRGTSVSLLQQRLLQLDFNISSIDGVFGEETRQAVIAFQKKYGLSQTGIVDTATWNKVNTVLRKNKPTKKKKITTTKIKSNKNALKPPVLIINDTKPLPAKADSVITTAKKYTGVPYKFGGTTPSGFDCSGYTQYVFKQHGIELPRTADKQCTSGRYIAKGALQPGDLVFFAEKKSIEHCGIYIGNNEFMHASSSKGIRADKLTDVYWGPKYYGARRIL